MRLRIFISAISLLVVACGDGARFHNREINKIGDQCTVEQKLLLNEDQFIPNDYAQYGERPDLNVLAVAKTFVTPTKKISEQNWPDLVDDLNFADINVVIQRQLARFKNKSPADKVKLGTDFYTVTQLKRSLEKFLELTESFKLCERAGRSNCQATFNTQMRTHFNAYIPSLTSSDPRYGEEDPVLFTGYYTPIVNVSKTKSGDYKYPVFAKPASTKSTSFTRVDIDFKNAFRGQNLEMYYAKDLFELYLLHVQGGGHMKIVGGSKPGSQYVSYDGTNGKTWRFISQYMLQKGYIEDASIESQEKYLAQNPQKQEEIYTYCPSYVYFKNSSTPPLGSDSVPLTDNRSIATDINYYKFKGLLAFVVAERPVDNSKSWACEQIDFQQFSRFYLDQDTGGAIRGKGRVDLYFGEGDYARHAAYNTVKRGSLYFFALKP